MRLSSLTTELSKLDRAGAESLREALLDASSSAFMELLVSGSDEQKVDKRRVVASTLAQALKRDLEAA